MNAFYNEIDPYCCAWLSNLMDAGHITPGVICDRSIEDIRPDELAGYDRAHFFAGIGVWDYALNAAGWGEGQVWTGSCPCQPFSAAGKGAGFADERHLWPAWFHLIRQRRPANVFGEQVASKDAGPWIDLVHDDMEALGYAFGAVPFPAAGVGAPHIRDRLYWVADSADQRLHGRRAGGSSDGRLAARLQSQRLRHAGGVGHTIGKRLALGQRVADFSGLQAGADHGQATERTGVHAGGMADTDAIGLGTLAGESIRDAEHHAESRGLLPQGQPAPGPTNGFWRAADWLFCRDGKWRPVEPIHVKVADGLACGVGSVRPDSDQETEKVNDSIGEKETRVPPISETSQVGLRGVRLDLQPARSPQGRGHSEQRAVELEDIVSLMSPSLALSELYRDWRTSEGLRVLCGAICQAGAVRDTPESIQAVWASLGQEAKDRLRLGFDASRWQIVAPFPLAHGATARVGRMRAYGNAINAEAARIFIESVMCSLNTHREQQPERMAA